MATKKPYHHVLAAESTRSTLRWDDNPKAWILTISKTSCRHDRLASVKRLMCRTCSVYTTRPTAEMHIAVTGTKSDRISVRRLMHGYPLCKWQVASLRRDGNHLTTGSLDAAGGASSAANPMGRWSCKVHRSIAKRRFSSKSQRREYSSNLIQVLSQRFRIRTAVLPCSMRARWWVNQAI